MLIFFIAAYKNHPLFNKQVIAPRFHNPAERLSHTQHPDTIGKNRLAL